MPDVNAAWSRIQFWLDRHAPKLVGNLNAGATDAEIEATQTAMGCLMPSEWRELYALCNGMNKQGNVGSLFFGMRFLPLDEVVREYRDTRSGAEMIAVRSADAVIRLEDMHNPSWIALAHDFGDTLLRVDMTPAPGGQVGQIIFTDHAFDLCILVASDVGQLLSEFADDLEKGRYFLNPDALADGNQFLTPIKEIDIMNWGKSPRWKHLRS